MDRRTGRPTSVSDEVRAAFSVEDDADSGARLRG
jgi:hypothetical protein